MELEVEKVRQLLKPEATQKQKKEGVSQLDLLLDSADFKHLLDANTAKLWPEDQLRAATWPGLVHLYLRHLTSELERHVATSLNAAMRLFKKLMAAAEDGSRTGRPSCSLLRRVGRLFEFMRQALCGEPKPLAPLGGPYGQELAQVLLKQLLPNAAYCQCSNSLVFADLMDAVMSRMESLMGVSAPGTSPEGAAAAGASTAASAQRGPAREELPRLAQLLLTLLANVPGRLASAFAADTLAFLHEALKWCDARGDTGRVAVSLLSCCCVLLQQYGQELRPHLDKLQLVAQRYCRRHWAAAGRQPRLKELLLRYSRLMLQLGGVAALGPEAVVELQQLLVDDINSPAHAWELPGSRPDGLLHLPAGHLPAALAAAAATAYQQRFYPQVDPEQHPPHLAAAAAAVGAATRRPATPDGAALLPRARSASAPRDTAAELQPKRRASSAAADLDLNFELEEGDALQPPRKRSRTAASEDLLLVGLELQPTRWAPVAALLLRLHAAQLPPSFLVELLQACLSSLTGLLTSGNSTGQLSRDTSSSWAAAAAVNGSPVGAGTMASAAADAAGGSGAGSRGVTPAPAVDSATSPDAVWLLRLLYEVAAAWPAVAQAPSGSSSSSSDHGGTRSSEAAAADSRQGGQQVLLQHWQRVWGATWTSLVTIVPLLVGDGALGSSVSSSSSSSMYGHAAASAVAHLWLLAALVQQQLLPTEQLLQVRPAVAGLLLQLLQPSTGAAAPAAARLQVMDAACGCLLALYGCLPGGRSTTSGLSQQEQQLQLQLHAAAAQLVAAAAASDTTAKAGHRAAHAIPLLLLPLMELLAGCPVVSAGVGSTPAMAAAAFLDPHNSSIQTGSRFQAASSKWPLMRLPIETQQLEVGGGAGGIGWWLSDAGVTRQGCDMCDLHPGAAQLSWLRFDFQQQHQAAHARHQFLSGAAAGALGQCGPGATSSSWYSTAGTVSSHLTQVLEQIQSTLLQEVQSAGTLSSSSIITQQLDALCTALAATAGLAAATALQQLQDLQQLLLPRPPGRHGTSNSSGSSTGSAQPGGSAVLVQLLQAVSNGLALAANPLQALLQGPLTGLVHTWLQPLTSASCHVATTQRLLNQAAQQAAAAGAVAAPYATAVAAQQQAVAGVVGRVVDLVTAVGRAVATAMTAAAADSAYEAVPHSAGQQRGFDLDDDLDLNSEPSVAFPAAFGLTATQGIGSSRPPTGTHRHGALASTSAAAVGITAAGLPGNSSAFRRYAVNGYVGALERLGLEAMVAVAAAAPEAVSAGVLQLWHHVHGLKGPAPTEGLLQLLAATMLEAVTAGAWNQTVHLLLMCDEERGLLRGKAVSVPMLQFVLQLLETLAVAAHAAGVDLAQPLAAAEASQPAEAQQQGPLVGEYALMGSQQLAGSDGIPAEVQARTVLQQMTQVLLAAHLRMPHSPPKDQPDLGNLHPQQLQLAQARAVAALTMLQPDLLISETSSLKPVAQELWLLVNCPCYQLRAAVGDLLQVLTSQGAVAAEALTTVKRRLVLELPAAIQQQLRQPQLQVPVIADQQPQYWETSALLLVKVAAAAVDEESGALLLLWSHAATAAAATTTPPPTSQVAKQLVMLREALSTLAAARGALSGRLEYFRVHMNHLVWHGHAAGLTTDQLLDLEPAVTGPSATGAFVQLLSPALLPALLASQDQDGFDSLADLQQLQPVQLLRREFGAAFGALYPNVVVPDQAAMAQEALSGPLVSGCMSAEEQTKQLTRQVAAIMQHMLRLVQNTASPDVPYFSVDRVLSAVRQLPGKNNERDNEMGLWRLLRPKTIQHLLLRCHQHITAVADPAYQLQRVGALQALLQVLQIRAVQPAHMQYVCSILLQLLQDMQLQPVCCGLLQQLWSLLLQAASRGDVTSVVATAFDQEEEAVAQQSMELLRLLLPPIVAAAVRALQSASEQQLQQWRLRKWMPSALGARQPHSGGSVFDQPFDLPVDHPVVSLLRHVVLQLPVELQPALQSVDPFLDVPVLRQAVQLQQQVLQQMTLVERLAAFAATAAAMAPESCAQAAQQLLVLLQQHEDELYAADRSNRGTAASSTPVLDVDARILRFSAGSGSGSSSSSRDGSSQRLLAPAAQQAAWRIGQLAGQHQDTAMAALAAQLLAAAGPLPGHVIVFDPPTDSCDAAPVAAASVAPADAKASDSKSGSRSKRAAAAAAAAAATADAPVVGAPAALQQLLPTVLRTLADCLVSADPDMVSVAQQVTSQLLATPEGAAALSALGSSRSAAAQQLPSATASSQMSDDLLQQVLQTYEHHGSSHSTSAATVVGSKPTPTDPAVWAAAGQPYAPWLRRLTSTLLYGCQGNQLLQVVAPAAELSDALTELLLPHALHQVCLPSSAGASEGDQAALAQQLAYCIQAGVLQPAVQQYIPAAAAGAAGAAAVSSTSAGGPVDPRCVLAVLRALEHLRSCHRHALVTADSRSAKDARCPLHWAKCYYLPLDYLAVATAAMAASAYFPALLYVEYWAQEKYGALQLITSNGKPTTALAVAAASSNAGGSLVTQLQQWRQQQVVNATRSNTAGQTLGQQPDMLEQLLLDFYAHVNEPDGLYAVAAAFGGSRSRLQLARHEGQWSNVVASQDQLLQSYGTAAAAAAAPSTGSTEATAQQGSATAILLEGLQRLGCLHTAQRYLAAGGHSSSSSGAAGTITDGPTDVLQLSDMQLQMAWRLADWGQVADSSSTVGGGTGLDRTWSASLDAMMQMQQQVPAEGGTRQQPCLLLERQSGLSVTAGGAAVSAGATSFNAALLLLLQQLATGYGEAFQTILHSTCLSTLCVLTRAGQQSAAAVNPSLLQLQMLELLRRAWSLRQQQQHQGAGQLWASNRSTEQLLFELLKGCGAAPAADQSSSSSSTSAAGQTVAGLVPPSATALAGYDYSLVDQMLALQAAVLQVLRRPDALLATLSATATTARKAAQYPQAAAALGQLNQLLQQASTQAAAGRLPGSSSGWLAAATAPDAPWVLESCKMMWAQGQRISAVQELQALAAALQLQVQPAASSIPPTTTSSSTTTTKRQLARTLALVGKWSAVLQSGSSATEVMRTMLDAVDAAGLQPAAAAAGTPTVGAAAQQQQPVQEDSLACRVLYRLAAYADARYRDVTAQMQTPEFQRQRAVIAAKRAQYDTLNKRTMEGWVGVSDLEARRGKGKQAQLRRVIEADDSAVQALKEMQTRCLRIALCNYIRTLQYGHLYDLPVVYRLCQLWFDLSSTTDTVNRRMQYAFASVPPAKFVPLTYQIASRISNKPDGMRFQESIWKALQQLAVHHPYHTCYSLVALSNGHLGPQGRPLQQSGAQALQQQVDLDKVEAACTLLQLLHKNSRLAVLLPEMELLVSSYIQLGAIPPVKAKNGTVEAMPFPASIRRRLVGHLDHIPLITQQLEVDPSGEYLGVPHLVDIANMIEFAGGINAPKVIRVTDTSGRQQRQLVKSGADDLRQDAVMQQFFGLVSSLLATDAATARRQLGMAVYKVVPCSPSAGVVEWVDHTIPCIDYLSGRSRVGGAHARYWRPGDMTFMEVYNTMSAAKPEQLLDVYTRVTQKYPPVLHHFFLENFTAPPAWFKARIHYTRAMAVSCMAGYLIGLGDRHFGNILLDLRTAGVVQIDLGVAFEQGQFLPTPEKVPFRLTRDVVDGMGAAGVEGPMRRCCEETMKVLRAHREALLTVIEVVLHDPLYNWQMTPVKARRRQQQTELAGGGEGAAGDADDEEVGGTSGGGANGSGGATQLHNADAERVVLKVKQKLEGLDGGDGEPRSVVGQVAALLAEAQDPERLGRMYVGWAPWL